MAIMQKSVTIRKIDNGFIVEQYLPSSKHEAFKEDIDAALAEARRLLG